MVLQFSQLNAPGAYISEETGGAAILPIASFQAVYMIGSSNLGDALAPVQVNSLADFTTKFGSSPSSNSVKLFFRNNEEGILFFVRTPVSNKQKITLTSATAGTYSLSFEGVSVSFTAASGDTFGTISQALISAVNLSNASSTVTAQVSKDANGAVIDAELIIRADDPSHVPTITTSTATKLTISDVTGTLPDAIDYVYAIEHFSDKDDQDPQGYLIAPQAFQLLTQQSDRLSVGLAMETLASDESYDWSVIVDQGAALNTPAQLLAEKVSYVSPQGHTSFYGPYVIDLEDAIVPPSAGIAAMATKRFREQGFQQPAAGAQYPLQGVKDVVKRYTNQEQSILDPQGVNLVRNLRNKGVVVWSMRTCSSDPFYRQNTVRVIMNVLNGTLRNGFDNDLFRSIDGAGILLLNIYHAAYFVCQQLWQGGALYGATEAEAFKVTCDASNNPLAQVEQGNIEIEVKVAPSPALEKLLIRTVRVAIGQVK